ncbi:MAG: hypothetical protein DMF62_14610 [Acidobacteria bacterium]|nr:MAG: hypothetical protein DMF62_14610 [Acidobacteriota bacterium]
MTPSEFLKSDVPDPEAAHRFVQQLGEKFPAKAAILNKDEALRSDVLKLVSCSPLFATTILQNPEHISWLGRERLDSKVRDKPALLESLARFASTHSQLEPHVVLARFRRRELMRIFLRDLRRLATIAEVTEEISNLADAILEYSLRLSEQELDNRYGPPQETDERGRLRPARLCIVSLGKLGSKELNYSSDIDILFIYSKEGKTSGAGSRGAAANIEYYSKLAEAIVKLVGGQGGEGAAYRVDMRLRPNGRVGPLALPLSDTVRYYRHDAAAWERQVLIRSRASAGDEAIFRDFYSAVEPHVFSTDTSVEDAIENVRLSKQKIDLAKRTTDGIDVKLGAGGIREIEFIAQALQLAYGGADPWLRAPHTLISLTRLSERDHISPAEHTKLFDAYDFLRRLEHQLQMENGLQTHLVPNDERKQRSIALRMGFADVAKFTRVFGAKMADVSRTFQRVFGSCPKIDVEVSNASRLPENETPRTVAEFDTADILSKIRKAAPRFAAIVDQRPDILNAGVEGCTNRPKRHFSDRLLKAVCDADDFGERLGALRREWASCLIEIVAADVDGKLSLDECKKLQTQLAEASIQAAFWTMSRELLARYEIENGHIPLFALGLGKLGGGGIDYDSDLDLLMVYDDTAWRRISQNSPAEFFAKSVEIFTTVLSSVTRDGSLYRVDLRLRPYGSKGMAAISTQALLDYIRNDAEIWELLAFVMLRHVGGDPDSGEVLESELRKTIFDRASKLSKDEISAETRRIRLALEKQRGKTKRPKDVDIKYGSGGLLDIYFAARYLQLANNIPNDSSDRSTPATLRLLLDHGATSQEIHDELLAGYNFLAYLDHCLRLVIGRTTRLPSGNERALETIADHMHLGTTNELFGRLTLHRLQIRSAFESIVGPG